MYEILTACTIFAGSVTTYDLGDPKFHARERAYDRLSSSMPWNLPAVFIASQSADPETAWRARRLIRSRCPTLDLWRCVLAPGMWSIMTCDAEPDSGDPDVPALWRANNLIVPGQQCWTTPEGEIRWVWHQCKELRKPAPIPQRMPTAGYTWNQ